MIIGDFNFECVAVTPYEADPVLIVDPDAVLSCAVTFEYFQVIAWEKSHIRERVGGMNLHEFSLNDLSKPIEAFGISALKNDLRISGSERSNHKSYCMTLYVPRQEQSASANPPALRQLRHSGHLVGSPESCWNFSTCRTRTPAMAPG
jgi:hypothetical protein